MLCCACPPYPPASFILRDEFVQPHEFSGCVCVPHHMDSPIHVQPEWAGHLAGAGFALRCWLCSASADVVMRRVYGALLVPMLVVRPVCAESGRV